MDGADAITGPPYGGHGGHIGAGCGDIGGTQDGITGGGGRDGVTAEPNEH